MSLQRCTKGHFVDPARNDVCPICGSKVVSAAIVPETRLYDPNVDAKPSPLASSETMIGVAPETPGFDPVVGWLVCTAGPEKGKDYRIRSERNFIGRAANMHICIEADSAISREKHAILSYDPRANEFRLAPAEGRGLIRLNDKVLETPATLTAFDSIEMGQSYFIFIPLCGEKFRWNDYLENKTTD